jgi:hypothetical protein
MTHLQEVRKQIANCEQRLRELHSALEDSKKIAGLDIADPMMREDARIRIPLLQIEFDRAHVALRNAEAEEHRLTWPRMQRQSAGR